MILTTCSLPHITIHPKRFYLRDDKERKQIMERTIFAQSAAVHSGGDKKIDTISENDEFDALIEEALRDATEDL